MNWHYVEQGQQLGPVSDDRLLELERSGTVNADTLVWHEGMTDWKPLRGVRADLKPSGAGAASNDAVPTAAVAQPSAGSSGPEAVCAECGKIFPIDEMIRHGNVRICSGCKPIFLQKLSEGAKVNTGELKYAGFWIRAAAKILDIIFLAVPLGAVFAAVMVPMARSRNVNRPNFTVLFLELGMMVVQMAYVIFFVGKFGATPGKMVCGLKIVTAEGASFGYGRATGRFFAEMLSGMVCYIGYLLVLFDKEKRALHDHICSTRVVRK